MKQKELNVALQIDLANLEYQNETFKKVALFIYFMLSIKHLDQFCAMVILYLKAVEKRPRLTSKKQGPTTFMLIWLEILHIKTNNLIPTICDQLNRMVYSFILYFGIHPLLIPWISLPKLLFFLFTNMAQVVRSFMC